MPFGRIPRFLTRRPKVFWGLSAGLLLLTLLSRICVAYFLANDGPGDGVIYSQIARNMLEQKVYSLDDQPPFSPTLVRLPGYPLFLAGVYSIFGHDNNTAVRIVQGVFDTGTCILVAMIAGVWTEERRRKFRTALWTFALAALCPFVVIYSGMILTETLATFLMVAMTLTATVALKARALRSSLAWWSITGALAGVAVLIRPDSGLFAGAVGLTLVFTGLTVKTDSSPAFFKRSLATALKGAVFAGVFILVLTPSALRNYRVFGIFQPLAPAHAEMPGEFVSQGYFRWLRTWVDDFRFIEPMQWNLGEKRIDIASVPRRTFDSAEERDRVAALLYRYNHPPGAAQDESSDESADDTSDDQSYDSTEDAASDENSDPGDANVDDNSGNDDDGDEDENKKDIVVMTPEIDAGFAQIADERIARAPFRYYLFLPVKRAAALWFDSHSLYYPFGGQLSPVSDLDYDVSQQYWLPLFVLLMWIYTLLAIGGVIYFWRERARKDMLHWLILLALMTLPRIVFFSTVENPEPRYLVELFAFTAILGGFCLSNIKFRKRVQEQTSLILLERLVSLDVFRGITIAAMVLVNEPGTWDAIYPPLKHGDWNSVTPTDWIFPFFLFIVGVSIVFALDKYKLKKNAVGLHFKIVKRAGFLFGVGLLLEIFPFYNIWTGAWFDPATTRITGVLQRIAVCYLAGALIFLHTKWRSQVVIIAVILLAYWAVMTLVQVPGCAVTSLNDPACNLAAYLDQVILGANHIWNQSRVYDPDGLLSTIPAIATTAIGVLTGQWLRSDRGAGQKVSGMLLIGCGLFIIGCIWSLQFPLNKSLWTSSYVVYTAGLALIVLAGCDWIVDLKGYRKWSTPFVVFGTNAIALYIGTTIFGKTLDMVELATPHDGTITLQEKIYAAWFAPVASPANASLMYAVAFVLVWLLLIWLLFRKRIFLKI